MRVVKVAANGSHVHVFSGLGLHLQFLHGADAVFRVENGNADAVNITVALQRRLAGIAGGCCQNHNITGFAGFDQRAGEQARHNLQRHIFKSRRGTVPQFQRIQPVTDVFERRGAAGKCAFRVNRAAVGKQLLFGIIGKKFTENLRRSFRVIHFCKRENFRF